MTFGRRTPEPFDSAEAAQLQRDIVATVVHELASITSALALRVDASRGTLPERDIDAVATLTAQLRTATKPLIWLRGSPGRGMLSPARTIEVGTWWHHTSQVASALLPHGSHMKPPADAALAPGNALPTEDLALFGMLVLATCRHFVDANSIVPLAMEVTLPRMAEPNPTFSLQMTPSDHASLESLVMRTTRWKRFCIRTAVRGGAALTWWQPIEGTPGAWRWSVSKTLPTP